jgi:uncharacterized membrane protein/protein-disulfide isomerase
MNKMQRSRIALLALALLGLGASVYALYVHYRLSDPSYIPGCEISDTVGCQQVLTSTYGSVLGVPVAAGGAIWAAAVLLLAWWGMRPQPRGEQAGRVAGYIFALSTLGLAAVFYFAYASFFVLGQACPVCMMMYVSVAGIFLVSAGAATSLTSIPAKLGDDLGGLFRSQTATTLTVAWLAASIAVLVLFRPGAAVTAAAGGGGEAAATAQPAEPALETLTPEQVAEWDKYLESQMPVADLLPAGETKVRVIKFNDYQCPACRQTWQLYQGIIARYEAQYPGVFVYESRDYPLELECGAGNAGHGMACEAAAAVRMAKAKGKHRELEAWLFNNQSFDMTRDDVKRGLREVAQITDFDEQYPKVLPDVRTDAQLGQKLGVSSTPTFYINGIKLGSLRPTYFDATIRHALRKAGVTS